MKSKVFCIDLDGTLCTEERTFERPLAKPIPHAADALRELRKRGHVIIIWSARGWEQYRITKKWLDDHKFEYDQILLGKPIADAFIDDRAIAFSNWKELLTTEKLQ